MLSWYIDCTDGIAVRSTVSQIDYRLGKWGTLYLLRVLWEIVFISVHATFKLVHPFRTYIPGMLALSS